MNTQALVAGSIIVAMLPLAVANATAPCSPYTYDATEAAGFYAWGAEIWQESNGIPGLQRTQTVCEDGSSLPKDTCISHKQYFALLSCAELFVTNAA